jgi:transmembrane 9 superfamily protein 2/4
VQGFYLPGVAPQDYARDDIVNLKVNKLSSTKTQLPYAGQGRGEPAPA